MSTYFYSNELDEGLRHTERKSRGHFAGWLLPVHRRYTSKVLSCPSCDTVFIVASRARGRKIFDETTPIRCASGRGLIREEIWIGEDGEIVRYNLAFINHFLTSVDNGRVLGYDNSHSHHHRHERGVITTFEFVGYQALLACFMAEVELLRREKR